MNLKNPLVAIIMGSDSDLPILQQAAQILDEFSVPYQVMIISAHRTPDFMHEFAKKAHNQGFKVIIAGAGGAAHLPGMTASLTTLPVIGVPIKTPYLKSLDSLLSIVQMPPGVPVATVAINGAKNAGLLAVKILAISDNALSGKLNEYIKNQTEKVLEKNEKLNKLGYEKYLEENDRRSNNH